jgi:hypothetical protein
MMLIVIWNSHGFRLIGIRPKGSKLIAGHHISYISSYRPYPQFLLRIKMTQADIL